MSDQPDLPDHLEAFVDDAGVIPDRASLPTYDSPAVGLRVCHLDDLAALAERRGSLRLHVRTAGAAEVHGLLAARGQGFAIEAATVRLQDPADPVANVRRVLVAAETVGLPDDLPLHVRVEGPPLGSWLFVADEVAAVGGGLALDLDDTEGSGGLEAWVDAALDRELPFVLHGGSVHTALDALAVTARLWGDADDLRAARRWCRAWQAQDVPAALAVLDPGAASR